MITVKERAMIENAVGGKPCPSSRSRSGRRFNTAVGDGAGRLATAPLPTRDTGGRGSVRAQANRRREVQD